MALEDINYTEPQIKGRRLRMARALTGMSRQDFHDKTNIATSAMEAWESGRIELNEKSAYRICEAFRQLEIFCSAEWLLYGEGLPPHLMSITEKTMFVCNNNVECDQVIASTDNKGFVLPSFLDSDIKKELSFFLNLHEHSIFLVIKEKLIDSIFDKGDCLAGIEENPNNLIGQFILLQDLANKVILCKLNAVNENVAKITIPPDNLVTCTKFQKTAKILWHRTP